MGGVDQLDRLLSSYRPKIRGKKWWWPLFTNALNLSIVAAWRIHCALHDRQQQLSHLAFLRQITICLLKYAGSERKQSGGGSHVDQPNDVRYDNVGHNSIAFSQGRCVICSTNTRSQCEKCGVRLHYAHGKSCFKSYHTKN